MNKYIFPLYDFVGHTISIESVQANSLAQAYEKLSEIWDLDFCSNQADFEDSMFEKDYEVGDLIEIDEL